MKKLVVVGGHRLNGNIHISGSKNASLPILMASILIGGESELHNVPAVLDISTTTELLGYLGASVKFKISKADGENVFTVDTTNINTVEAPYEIVSKMRASFWVLGSLLGRFGEAKVSLPGGCTIGPRPCDIYIDVLKQMGVNITMSNGYIIAKAKARNRRLKGADVTLRLPSVGATHNTIMAACLANGVTTIRNAAKEPEVVDLCNYLINAGAKIEGFGTDTIVISGVKKLHPNRYRVISDRVEAFSYIMAAAVTSGDVILDGLNFMDSLSKPIKVLRKMKLSLRKLGNNGLRVRCDRELKPVNIVTEVYPGFSTDMQAPIMALLAITKGESRIQETIFENRFMHVPELNRLGANIVINGNEAIINGVNGYSGTNVMASDIRAGMALLIAALGAEGKTEISRIYHIERGYENFTEKLTACGAELELVDDKMCC
ncbi:MAG: UDP-N-acetylglucosamine 1-carboxyvinyltransferase [Rickettsiales bacterium]|jgi:UDP-N-acetylglucosamine 1-carboxyvinyltransferase|nr:UDP-N-acetylglucosamine 1-carboxyvinyltransferase [Rickettsiales bacterium]